MREPSHKDGSISPRWRSFSLYLSREKRYSAHTLSAYEQDVRQAQSFIRRRFGKDIEQASHRMLRTWVMHLAEGGVQAVSINRKLACLRSFFKFLLSRGYVSENPVRLFRSLKTPSRVPAFVKEQEMERLLDHFSFANDFAGVRDRLVCALLYGTGLRLAELIKVTLAQLTLTPSACYLKVVGKGNKERIIPLPVSLREDVRHYLRVRAQCVGKYAPEDRLLVSEKGKNVYPMMIYRMVKKYLTLTTDAHKKSPHVLRHTYATHLLNRGANLEAIRSLLGHSSLAATQVYTHSTMEKLQNVYKKAHPKA